MWLSRFWCVLVFAGWGVSGTPPSGHHPASPRELRGDLLRRADRTQLQRQWVQRLQAGWDYETMLPNWFNLRRPVIHNRHKCIFMNRALWGGVALLYHQSQRHRRSKRAGPRWPHWLAARKEEIRGPFLVLRLLQILQLTDVKLCLLSTVRRRWWLQTSALKTLRGTTSRKSGWLTSIT